MLEITKQLNEKDQLIESLYFEINGKNEQIFELQDEIKKRKYDMNEMSRRIIEMDQELKSHDCQWKPLSRSLSGLSISNCSQDEKTNGRWGKMPRIK